MKHVLTRLLAGMAALACLPGMAQAAVTYTFTVDSFPPFYNDDGPASFAAFQLTTGDYITSDTTFDLADVTSCSVTLWGGAASFCAGPASFELNAYGVADRVGFGFDAGDQGIIRSYYYFDRGVFAANGVHDATPAINGNASLTVSGFADPGGVPEPSTWAMMLVGFGGLGAALRRRRAAYA